MLVRPLERQDAPEWARMRIALWPSEEDEDNSRIVEEFLEGRCSNPAEVLLALDDDDRIAGFVELSIRPFAEGCHTGKVAYLEGWYVEPDLRGQGFGAALVEASGEWGRSMGCVEMGSDSEIGNETSAAAHIALGFLEQGRIICFRKPL